MANKNETSLGAQVILAIVVLVVAWVVLKWVIKVVLAVATTVVVIGAILFAAWILIGRKSPA